MAGALCLVLAGYSHPSVLPLSVVGNSTRIGDSELDIRPILEYPCGFSNTILERTRNSDAPRTIRSTRCPTAFVAQFPLEMVIKPVLGKNL